MFDKESYTYEDIEEVSGEVVDSIPGQEKKDPDKEQNREESKNSSALKIAVATLTVLAACLTLVVGIQYDVIAEKNNIIKNKNDIINELQYDITLNKIIIKNYRNENKEIRDMYSSLKEQKYELEEYCDTLFEKYSSLLDWLRKYNIGNR